MGKVQDPVGAVGRVMSVNFMGAVHCVCAALPHLRQTKGMVVGVSSLAGTVPVPGASGYSASKAAMNLWLAALRLEEELADSGVGVLVVDPGGMCVAPRRCLAVAPWRGFTGWLPSLPAQTAAARGLGSPAAARPLSSCYSLWSQVQ